jgi:drug/metabolite transporter (DMT)-like permease
MDAARMTSSPITVSNKDLNKGLWIGLLGVLIFSATLPFTRMAVGTVAAPQLSPWFVAIGRAAVAGLLAIGVLYFRRATLPSRSDIPWLMITACGVVFGFPLFTTWAMRYVPSSHGAVITGLLPLVTALFGALIHRDRPSIGFWVCALLGSAVVIAFALREGGGSLQAADWALFAAMIAAPIGYATGAKLSAKLGAVHAICWVLVISLPLTLPLALWFAPPAPLQFAATAWIGFAYVSVFSMFIGFFAWYQGLALGGVARVSQTQLLQPFFTLLLGALLLGERLDMATLGFALIVVALVFIGRKMPIIHVQAIKTS